jgi:hypothetical protein
MEVAEALEAINALVKVVTVVSNSIDAQGGISKIIADRVAAGRTDWTDDEKAEVQAALESARAYAVAELAKPDAA